jgi:hypothetical protein
LSEASEFPSRNKKPMTLDASRFWVSARAAIGAHSRQKDEVNY